VKQTAQSLGGNAQEGSGNARRHRTAIAYAAPHKWQGQKKSTPARVLGNTETHKDICQNAGPSFCGI